MRKFNENYSLVRVLHAIPDGDTVDVYLNDIPFFKSLNFTEFTPYVYIPEGDHILSVYLENTVDNPIVSQKISIKKDGLVTVAITQNDEGVLVLPIEEDKELADYKNSKIRFVHLVPNGRVVNILLQNKETFSNVEFTDATEYIEVQPGEYEVSVEAVESGTTISSDKVKINSDRIYSFYAVGNAPNFEVLQSVDGATFLI